MDDAQAGVLQEFMAVTGVDDIGIATSVLHATNWILDEAVQLHFATGGDLGGGGGGAQPMPDGIVEHPSVDEEQVRAPLPVVRDRLYGDAHGPHGVPPGRVARYGAPPDRGPTHVDVFKDFGPAAAAAAAGGSMNATGPLAAGSSAAAAAGGGAAAVAPKLSDLFKPPSGLLFVGDWAAAAAAAAKDGRWLLVNIQSADEFASHRLNRDTWGNSLVQDMLKGTFVFWQCYNTSDQGQVLIGKYQLEQLPAVLIVDPITGAKLWERAGFISAEALVEELVPYMDCGPNDPGASELAHRAYQQSAKRRNRSGSGAGAAPDPAGMTDDEALALALAMSVEEPGAGSGAADAMDADDDDDDDDDLDEEAIWQEVQRRQRAEEAAAAARPAAAAARQSAGSAAAAAAAAAAPAPAPAAAAAVDVAAVQAAAAARLPAEPGEGAGDSCRVAFRLPDGSRLQRRFNTSDTVAALQDYVVSVSADAAGLPSFHLSEARPGAAPLADPAATIAQAGVANAMLVIKTS